MKFGRNLEIPLEGTAHFHINCWPWCSPLRVVLESKVTCCEIRAAMTPEGQRGVPGLVYQILPSGSVLCRQEFSSSLMDLVEQIFLFPSYKKPSLGLVSYQSAVSPSVLPWLAVCLGCLFLDLCALSEKGVFGAGLWLWLLEFGDRFPWVHSPFMRAVPCLQLSVGIGLVPPQSWEEGSFQWKSDCSETCLPPAGRGKRKHRCPEQPRPGVRLHITGFNGCQILPMLWDSEKNLWSTARILYYFRLKARKEKPASMCWALSLSLSFIFFLVLETLLCPERMSWIMQLKELDDLVPGSVLVTGERIGMMSNSLSRSTLEFRDSEK